MKLEASDNMTTNEATDFMDDIEFQLRNLLVNQFGFSIDALYPMEEFLSGLENELLIVDPPQEVLNAS